VKGEFLQPVWGGSAIFTPCIGREIIHLFLHIKLLSHFFPTQINIRGTVKPATWRANSNYLGLCSQTSLKTLAG